jgi:hypothetical protein
MHSFNFLIMNSTSNLAECISEVTMILTPLKKLTCHWAQDDIEVIKLLKYVNTFC